MKNLVLRTISGSLYVAVMVGAVLAGGAWLTVLLCVLGIIGVYELTCMTCGTKYPRLAATLDMALVTMMIMCSCVIWLHGSDVRPYAVAAIVLLLCRMISELYARHDNALHALGASALALVYVALPLSLVPLLYSMVGSHMVLAILIFIWINDTGAFCTGCTLGRHRLFERISPKKSWEGFFGGLAFCIVAALIFNGCCSTWLGGDYGWWAMCRLAIIVVIASTFGDLVESLIKRTAGVKDSGNIIPGHGGVLDRIDSLLFVIPASLAYFLFISM